MANITYNADAIANKRFGGPNGTAQTSTPEQLAAKQAVLSRGSTMAERSVDLHAGSNSTTSAPPTAAAAPTKGNSNVFTGLCDALNQHQQDLVKKKIYEIADQYAIEFASPAIAGAQVVKPGPVAYKNTAAKDTNTAQAKLDSKTDQVNVNSQEWNLVAGTQIVQFIDQVMRSSRYITDQQLGNYNEDGKWVPSKTANTNGVTAWYKISVVAKQLGYDKKRRDNAYRMTFIISPYAINQMDSEYFPNSNYRGAHKEFNYWFTGLNTQILSYEQEYNSAYYTTMTGNATGLATPPPTGRDQRKRTYMATSEQRGQGQANYVNEPADSAAAFLYSVSDFAEVNMKIVGDPAWMQQGEASTGVNAQTFDYKPFNPDGTINYDSQEVTFTVSFNRPTDYDFSTGIMNVNASSGAPKETFAYIAKTVKNTFSKGQFTQELSGSLLPLTSNPSTSANANGRPGAVTTATVSRSSPRTAEQIVAEQNAAFEYGTNEGSEQTRMLAEQDAGLFDEPKQPPTPQPASSPAAPTSSGSIDYNAGLAGTSEAPPKIDVNSPIQANAEEAAAVKAYVDAGGTFPRGTGPITSGPLYDAVLSAKSSLATRQQANAVNTTPAQVIAKDDQ